MIAPWLLAPCETLVRWLLPLTRRMSDIPFTRFAPICATHPPELTVERQYEWTVLNTLDWLNPHDEICKDHREAADLLKGAGLARVESALGLAWETKP